MLFSKTLSFEQKRNRFAHILGLHFRSTFSPIFTSGKLKMMMQFIANVSQDLADEFSQAAGNGQALDMKSALGKYSMDTIASCAFGVDAKSFTDKNSVFVDNAKMIFRYKTHSEKAANDIQAPSSKCSNRFHYRRAKFEIMMFTMALLPITSQIINALKIPIFKPKQTKFFMDSISQTIKHRIETGTKRNDIVDLMVEALRSEDGLKGDLEKNEHEGEQFEKDQALDHGGQKKEFDELTIVSTAMVMLVAGSSCNAEIEAV